jgi:heme exporter protein A
MAWPASVGEVPTPPARAYIGYVESEVAVELRNVTKAFGPVRALVAVSATVKFGRVFVVEGANGSGKSTMLSLVAGLTRPTSGTVDHGALGLTPAKVRAQLGWLGHETLCYGDLSGLENLRLAASLYGCGEDAVQSAVERFEMGPFANRPVRTYSRGQRQRLALARSVVHSPRLLLLDEPSTGLDAASVDVLVGVVGEEVSRGAAVVVVTHDRPLMARLPGDRIRLERGRAVPTATA